jgi:serine/threonine-protein kinase
MPEPEDETTPAAPRPRALLPDRGELAPGTAVGDYVIRGTLAAGGFGAVHSAEHRVLRRRVALKVLHPELSASPEMVQRFIREAQVVNRIRHPNIVDIHDFGTLPDGRPYFVMELLSGPSLKHLIEQRGRLTLRELLPILRPVAAALEAAHAEGVVHRDLKASNVMVVREGDPPLVKLLDFGIAKLLQPEKGAEGLTVAGQRLGTPQSMAPEQIRGGKVDARADVYAFGVLVFHALTGGYPFDHPDPNEIERMHLESPVPRPSSRAPVPAAVDALVLRALEKVPEHRPASVAALLADLEVAAGLRGPSRASAKARQGVAVQLEARLDGDAADDETVLAALSDLLDAAEQDLLTAGFRVALQTASLLLAVRLLDDDPRRAARQTGEAVALARAIASRTTGTPRLSVEVQVHQGPALVERGTHGDEAVGGALLEPGAWPPARQAQGVMATDVVLAALDAGRAGDDNPHDE